MSSSRVPSRRGLRLPREAVPRDRPAPGDRDGDGAARELRRCARRPTLSRRPSAARKAIERAKGILMQREGLSEEEAFARLRARRARSRGVRSRSSRRRSSRRSGLSTLGRELRREKPLLTRGDGRRRRPSQAANATSANGARTISSPRATTPSHARTFSASSMVRSITRSGRDCTGSAGRDDRELDRRHTRLALGGRYARPELRSARCEASAGGRGVTRLGLRVEASRTRAGR